MEKKVEKRFFTKIKVGVVGQVDGGGPVSHGLEGQI